MNDTKQIHENKVYRIKQIHEKFNISRATAWRYAKDGLLTPIHITPRVTVFDAKEVHKLFGIA